MTTYWLIGERQTLNEKKEWWRHCMIIMSC